MGQEIASKSEKPKAQVKPSLATIAAKGFKSLRDWVEIELRPLTILAGANSSGKSSIMQPFLMMKQTLEAPYDSGPLKLDGPNVSFANARDFLWKPTKTKNQAKSFTVKLEMPQKERKIVVHYQCEKIGLKIVKMEYTASPQEGTKVFGEGKHEILKGEVQATLFPPINFNRVTKLTETVFRRRCFLDVMRSAHMGNEIFKGMPDFTGIGRAVQAYIEVLQNIIHLPGLRGNPERAYPKTGRGPTFPGVFPQYMGGIIAAWKEKNDKATLEQLNDYLMRLGLTWKVQTKAISDARIELSVGRLPVPSQGGAQDLVNIADVGVGVSQVLPVLIALLVAKPGQVVYIEEPEIHLHPKAQVVLARLLLMAAQRGIIVVAETHSQFLLIGVQEQVASGAFSHDLVKLHWFTRDDDGATTVTSGDLDKNGAFGNWPEDFSIIDLELQDKYLKAAMK